MNKVRYVTHEHTDGNHKEIRMKEKKEERMMLRWS